ncbi:MAG: Plug domain-containing protein [Chromatiales bacterium]|nr:Plug domain-containing protein [Chromatiales bacterium]
MWLMVGGAAQARIVWSGVSDDDGSWTSGPLAPGSMDLHVEAFGYRNAAGPVETLRGMEVFVSVDLVPEPLEMEPLVVVSSRRSRLDTSGFNQRRMQGQGSGITRQEFERRNPTRPSDVFRLLPGVSVGPGRRGNAGLLRYRGCSPDLVLDGVPLVGGTAPDDILSVMDIEAVEVSPGCSSRPGGWGRRAGR